MSTHILLIQGHPDTLQPHFCHALTDAYADGATAAGHEVRRSDSHAMFKQRLAGRPARVVVTMGMPAALYRWVFCAHSVRALERNILGFVGFAPVHETLIGGAGDLDPKQVEKWLDALKKAGANGD